MGNLCSRCRHQSMSCCFHLFLFCSMTWMVVQTTRDSRNDPPTSWWVASKHGKLDYLPYLSDFIRYDGVSAPPNLSFPSGVGVTMRRSRYGSARHLLKVFDGDERWLVLGGFMIMNDNIVLTLVLSLFINFRRFSSVFVSSVCCQTSHDSPLIQEVHVLGSRFTAFNSTTMSIAHICRDCEFVQWNFPSLQSAV